MHSDDKTKLIDTEDIQWTQTKDCNDNTSLKAEIGSTKHCCAMTMQMWVCLWKKSKNRNTDHPSAIYTFDKKCNEKGLNFISTDLRWGVTADQCNSGQVIKICLDEIENCQWQ